MLAKRLIPCLDVDKGRVVKGVNFVSLKDAGDPVKLAKFYYEQGADELIFLDITASSDKRNTMIEVAQKVAQKIFIPFTIGGGIRTIDDMKSALFAGADKVAVNTSAIKNPPLISDGAKVFGSQCIVVAIDAKRNRSEWEVYINGGRTPTGISVLTWVREVERLGAGEILLTSMDRDGTKDGFDIELTRMVSESVQIPVVASGGAGTQEDFIKVFKKGKADAALAASLFHFGELTINEVKKCLLKNKIAVRSK